MSNRINYGIDLGSENTVFCFQNPNTSEPRTLSTVVGSERYQIPTALARSRGDGRLVFGEEAVRLAELHEATPVTELYRKALAKESIFLDGTAHEARALLAKYLAHLFLLSGRMPDDDLTGQIYFSTAVLDAESAGLVRELGERMGAAPEQVHVIDRADSFYYYVFHQEPQIFLQDVVLFDCPKDAPCAYLLTRNPRSTPQTVTVDRENLGALGRDRDASFLKKVTSFLEGKSVSGVFLTGDGFDGGWLSESLPLLCQGRRVFSGKNLFARGACHAACVRDSGRDWPFLHMGEDRLRLSVFLHVQVRGKVQSLPLLSAGESWYEAACRREILLDEVPELTFYLREFGQKQERPARLKLSGLEDRPPRTSRLAVSLRPLSALRVAVTVEDLGFGELFAATGRVWNYILE